MEDSSHEQAVEQPATESKINRRDMAKLLGAVTALGASLGVTFGTSATVDEGARLKLKFLKQAPKGDTAKAQLLCTIEVSPKDQRRIMSTEGSVELRVVASSFLKNDTFATGSLPGDEVTISSQIIPIAAWIKIKTRPKATP